jgi:anti-anti-sigma factor
MGFPRSPDFEVQADVSNGVARFAPTGELDMLTAPALQEHLDRAINEGIQAALLDLGGLTFMDANGVHLLFEARDRAQQNGEMFAVVGVGGQVRKVLELTNTVDLIDEGAGVELIRRFTQSDATAARTPPVVGHFGSGAFP